MRGLSNPLEIKRSDLSSIIGLTYFECQIDFTNSKSWQVEKIDSNTGAPINLVDLASNPTRTHAELVFSPNTLTYGLYKVSYQVTIESSLATLSSQALTYIKVVPTGINVFVFKYGMQELSFGYEQEIEISPVLYSIDYDQLVDINSLSFTFSCRKIDVNAPDAANNKISFDNSSCFAGNWVLILKR